MELAFALGKVYADLKLDAQSFEYYRQGNALKRATLDYSIGQDRELFAAIKQTVTSEFLQRHAGTGCDDATPIFIIGMPRSGTTLTEQILASHSQVHGAGELNELKFLIERACESHTQEFPQGLLGLNKTELSAIASTYLERLHAYAPGAPRITDKMPHNFLYLGLIHLLFPKAKIIHCLRNPMDNALSIYRALFARSHAYAYDLEELGQYYHLYQDLMAHWRELMPGGFYELRYEDLVSDQETQTRRLLDYCELPWEDACLEFYQTSRVVRTASLAQVRQPMHRNSVEAWRRFERQLQPFVQALRA
ncbi:MAG: sulfotransferase [Gammaproteobacteria bacterium]